MHVILTYNNCHSPHTPFVPYFCNSLIVPSSSVVLFPFSYLQRPKSLLTQRIFRIKEELPYHLISVQMKKEEQELENKLVHPRYRARPFPCNSACILPESSHSDVIATSSILPRALFAIFLIIFCIIVFVCMSSLALIVRSLRVEMVCYSSSSL